MLFNSYEFLFLFLPIVLLVYWGLAVKQRAWRLFWLTAASYYFYAYWNLPYLAIIFASTAIDFLVGPKIYNAENKRVRFAWLCVSLLSNLGGLAFFKYYNFATDQVNGFGALFGTSGLLPVLNIALPIGISFTAFESLSYTIDLYRREVKPAPDFLSLACFVSVFPRMIAGPIIRYKPFAPQIERDPRTRDHRDDAVNGIYFFVVGLAKKVLVADTIARTINPLLAGTNYLDLGLVGSWGVMLGYTFQLYFDFSGYSDMAVGLGKMLGFDLPQNFNSPYKAVSLIDFWRRWHITLSTWLRDYLYIPLGGSRGPEFATMRNLLITMVLGGLWHGANWTFVIWGVYHGALLVLNHQLVKLHLDTNPVGKILSNPILTRAVTFILVVIGWTFFRADSLAMASHLLQSMAGLNGVDWDVLRDLNAGFWMVVAFAFLLANFAPDTWDWKPTPRLRYAVILGVLGAVCVLLLGSPSPFLYFQF